VVRIANLHVVRIANLHRQNYLVIDEKGVFCHPERSEGQTLPYIRFCVDTQIDNGGNQLSDPPSKTDPQVKLQWWIGERQEDGQEVFPAAGESPPCRLSISVLYPPTAKKKIVADMRFLSAKA